MIATITCLMEKGVRIPNPESIEIGPEVDPERISGEGVVIHSGCKLFGETTLISAGSRLGYEGPVTVKACQIGPDVELKGGYFENAVFLGTNQMGLGAHVRAGTILEEQASGAHTVGLKQTILFPFVTLGSLINFCDCLMAGGTSRQNHSEVGSSYIHFNYTPNQDKATPSMLGDVPRGVMLDQPPIFLGGQGGLVGPCRVDFGNIIAAGSICRTDVTDSGHLLIGISGRGGRIAFKKGRYRSIRRIVLNNVTYIAHLLALMQWYRHVRSQFVSHRLAALLFEGLVEKLSLAIEERVQRFDQFISLLPASPEMFSRKTAHHGDANQTAVRHHQALIKNQTAIRALFDHLQQSAHGDIDMRDRFLEALLPVAEMTKKAYLQTITSLDADTKSAGTHWLAGIVAQVIQKFLQIVPALEKDPRHRKG